jgi:hypothetical protein
MSTGIVLWLYLALLRFVQVNSFAPEEMAKKNGKRPKNSFPGNRTQNLSGTYANRIC